jgi:phage-related protein
MDVIGSFTVQMEIDPFQYQDTVPIYATKAFELYNPVTANAEPTITLYGNGQLEILIDNRRLKLLNVKDSITLDTEMQTAETGTESKETDMIGDFPYFELRANTISFTADRIKIEPNWRWLM